MAATRTSAGMLLAISVVWGSTWIANGMLGDAGSALYVSVWRYLLAWVLLALFWGGLQLLHLLQRRDRTEAAPPAVSGTPTSSILSLPEPASAKTYAWLRIGTVLGFSMFALPDLLLVVAAQHGTAAWTPMVYAALPLGLLLAQGELRAAAILGLCGMLVLLNGSLPVTTSKLLWVLPIAAAVYMQGWSLLYVRRHLDAAWSMRCMMVQMLTATFVFEVALQLRPERSPHMPLRSWPASSLGALCFLAGPAVAAAYPLYYRLLRGLEPAQLAASAWVQTVISIAEGALLLRQRPGWQMTGAACLLIVCAVRMFRENPGEQAGLSISFPDH